MMSVLMPLMYMLLIFLVSFAVVGILFSLYEIYKILISMSYSERFMLLFFLIMATIIMLKLPEIIAMVHGIMWFLQKLSAPKTLIINKIGFRGKSFQVSRTKLYALLNLFFHWNNKFLYYKSDQFSNIGSRFLAL